MPDSRHYYFSLLIGILLLVLVVLCVILVRQYNYIRRSDTIHYTTISLSLKRHTGPLKATDVDDISSWMTFQYVNFLFNVPQNYFKDRFDIIDPKYPRITLSRFASRSGESSSMFLSQVKDAVKNYLTASSTITQ